MYEDGEIGPLSLVGGAVILHDLLQLVGYLLGDVATDLLDIAVRL